MPGQARDSGPEAPGLRASDTPRHHPGMPSRRSDPDSGTTPDTHRRTPGNDFTDLDQVQDRLAAFGRRYNETVRPFRWKFTPADLKDLLARIETHEQKERQPQPVIMALSCDLLLDCWPAGSLGAHPMGAGSVAGGAEDRTAGAVVRR